MAQTLQLLQQNLESWRGEYICVSNVHTTVTAYQSPEYRAVQNGAVMALPDGGPLSAYSRKHGFANAQRVTGPDLMREVLKKSAETGWKHYFYGSTPETLELLRQKLAQSYPGAQVVGMESPPFRPLTQQEEAASMEKIRQAAPDFIWGRPSRSAGWRPTVGHCRALCWAWARHLITRQATYSAHRFGCSAAAWNGFTALCRTLCGFCRDTCKPICVISG